ncbi:hypothetical protein NDU88_001093 [Pleurodeles waltl]|uniref:Uncharacterized protein n=1 Tax=Pleurodeles waltl TaxID=8319 RepID=A0AAV7V9Y5_PLEWA|nr:hypothetical protein NDU88_001093 [Pleurodeles waltl]
MPSGRVSGEACGTGEAQTTVRRRSKRRHHTPGTWSVEQLKQEREESRQLVETVTSVASLLFGPNMMPEVFLMALLNLQKLVSRGAT